MMRPAAAKAQILESSTCLKQALIKIAFLQKCQWPEGTKLSTLFRLDGFSFLTFLFADGESGRLGFAPLFSGNYCILKEFSGVKKYEFFGHDGEFLFTHDQLNATPLYVDMIEMEPDCVFVSHLYNILCFEYSSAKKAEANINRIKLIEDIVGAIATDAQFDKWFTEFNRDRGFEYYNERLVETEHNQVLKYTERQELRKKLIKDRQTVVDVKTRAHRFSSTKQIRNTFVQKLQTRARIVSQRPLDVVKNIAYQYTFGVFFWFVKVVRGNIGYSIALAVYGPFTFYFITQPMNPHAMWAVGKVRNQYIQTVDSAKEKFSHLGLLESEKKIELPSTAVASVFASATPLAPVDKTPDAVVENQVVSPFAYYKPGTMGILVSSDVPTVANQTWTERMSNFKDMQIGYEENLQTSERMGRLEQMETQLNFPLIAESTYRETERYLKALNDARLTSIKPEMTKFIDNERARTMQVQLYIWDRLVRFISDDPYVMLDSSKEQMKIDYYMGRSFLFLKELTESLTKQHETLPKPKNFEQIEKLARAYEKEKVEGDSIEARLKANSLLSKQKNFFSTREMRAHIKRQWEILYLLQNKAQEASNFGMQTYNWSVRNAIWVLQSFYANKNRDLALILRATPEARTEIKERIEPLYESLFHILTMEYVSIKTELGERLNNDIESLQRMVIIQGMKDFFTERDTILKPLL